MLSPAVTIASVQKIVVFFKATLGPWFSNSCPYHISKSIEKGVTQAMANDIDEEEDPNPILLDVNNDKLVFLANSYPAKWIAIANAMERTARPSGVMLDPHSLDVASARKSFFGSIKAEAAPPRSVVCKEWDAVKAFEK
jgi:hypothetical protein